MGFESVPYNSEHLRELIEKSADFLASQKIFVSLWSHETQKPASTQIDSNSILKKFYIPRADSMRDFNNAEAIEKEFSLITSLAENMEDEVGDMAEDGRIEEETARSAIQIYYRSLIAMNKKLKSEIRNFNKACSETDMDTSDKKQRMEDAIQKSLKTIFDSIIPGLRRGMEQDNHPAYGYLLTVINSFLKNIGVWTADIEMGSKIDFNLCDECSEDLPEQITQDLSRNERVCGIEQLPYILGNNYVLSPGRVRTWRYKI